MAHLSSNSYGKQRVRLTKVSREGGRHEVHEYAVEVMLEGDFDAVYTEGDNSSCVPTDTMKNTVYAVARTTDFKAPEEFALALVDHLLTRYPQVREAAVSIFMERWHRITVDGDAHPHAFVKAHGRRTAQVSRGRNKEGSGTVKLRGGISGMEVFKSAGSGFSGFHQDELTVLPEAEERILATSVDALWDYSRPGSTGVNGPGRDFNTIWSEAERILTEVFATYESPSLQATLYRMGERILEAIPAIERISFNMPNQHHVLFDLDRFGLDNPNEIFYGADSPYGIITGTVARSLEGDPR